MRRIIRDRGSLGLTKIAVFYQNDAYGQTGLDGVQRALARRQLKPLAVGTVERNSADVAKAMAALLPSQPEAIVQISAYKSCAAFIKQARAKGYGGQFFNVSFVGAKALADEQARAAASVAALKAANAPLAQIQVAEKQRAALPRTPAEAEERWRREEISEAQLAQPLSGLVPHTQPFAGNPDGSPHEQAQASAAHATLAQYEAQLAQARRDLKRAQDLVGRHLVSQQSLEDAQTQVQTLTAQVDAQHKQIDLTRAGVRAA